MKYTIQPVTPADAPFMATIVDEAFQNDGIVGLISPNVPKDIYHAYNTKRLTQDIAQRHLEGAHFYKAVEEETGKVVAFAKWQYPHTLTAEEQAEKEAFEKARDPPPEGSNLALRDEFFGAIHNVRRKWVDDSKDYVLHWLCTLPSHHRLGIGSMLIRQGLAKADRDNARTFIEASVMACPLYLKHGWKPVDEILMNMVPYGGSGVVVEKCLFREPGAG